MAIEVKQMIIKSTLVNGSSKSRSAESPVVDIEQLKEMLMEECRELITESLNELRER